MTHLAQKYEFVAITFAYSMCIGCGGSSDSRPDRVPVTGQILLNGQAVSDALVVFYPQTANAAAAQSMTDSNGQFSLTSFEPSDGAVPGTYTVLVTKQSANNEMNAEQSRAYFARTGKPPPLPTYEDLLPKKFSSQQTSDLSAEVLADGENNFVFDLKSGS